MKLDKADLELVTAVLTGVDALTQRFGPVLTTGEFALRDGVKVVVTRNATEGSYEAEIVEVAA